MRHAHLVSVALCLLNACGGGGKSPTPPDNTPSTITLSPAGPLTLASGSTATVTASVATSDGRPVSPAITWSTSDATVATVAGGLITAIRTGTATITASASPASKTLQVTVNPGTATQLAIRTQPGGAPVGTPLATQPVIEVRDAAGNVVTGSTASVSASIATGGGAVGGTSTVAAIGGVATFTALTVSGTAGDRTLTFASPGLTSVTSASFTMTAPAGPVITLDNSAIALSSKKGSNPTPATVRITNGGGGSLTGMSVNVVYDPAGPTGWINASLDTPNAPATLTISAASTAFDVGTYRATVQVIAPGATNSPASVSVTLSVAAAFTVAYGTPTDKVKVLDVNATYKPPTTVTDAGGQPVTDATLTYVSRSSSVATVAADGTITARGPGDAWVTVTSAGNPDSVFVIVPLSAAAGVVRSSITTWSLVPGDTAFVNVVLDTRGLTVGSGLFAVSVQLQPSVFTTIQYFTPVSSPTPLVNNSSPGVLRVTVSSASGMTGSVALVNLKIVGRTSGLAGWVTFTPLDVSGVDGTDMTRQITSTRLPLVIK